MPPKNTPIAKNAPIVSQVPKNQVPSSDGSGISRAEQAMAFLSKYPQAKHNFSAFCVLPRNVRFQTQEDTEDIILLLRRHPVTNVPWILIAILFMFAPMAALPISNLGGLVAFLDRISIGLLPTLLAFWYLGIVGYILVNFFFWYFNVNIITNRRLIDLDFYNLLYREFSEALLVKIEDVTSVSGGFVGAIFDYGDVIVQTAATMERLEFDRVPHPQEVVRIITNVMEAARYR